jgi:Protein of unknown function (DUF2752)
MPVEPLPTAVSEGFVSQPPVVRRARHPLLDTGRPLGRAVRLGMVAAGLVLLMAAKVPLCPVAIVTRHPCPGCGLTRATLAALAGDFHAAYHLHPLVFLVTPVIVIAFTYNAIEYVRRGQWFASEKLAGRWVNAAWITLGVLVVLLWIARFFGAFGGPVPV